MESVEIGESTKKFANAMGLGRGVGGFVLHTVPVAIHAWLSSPDNFEKAIVTILERGGDTDTTAAIVGATVGARVKEGGIPKAWIDGIWEPTFGPKLLRVLGSELLQTRIDGVPRKPSDVPVLLRLGRNALFISWYWRMVFVDWRRLIDLQDQLDTRIGSIDPHAPIQKKSLRELAEDPETWYSGHFVEGVSKV